MTGPRLASPKQSLGGLTHMKGATALEDTVLLLRGIEHYCYQVAHYLLETEPDAAEASKSALLQLSRDPLFTRADNAARMNMAKSATIGCAMQVARRRCAGAHAKKPGLPVANDRNPGSL